MTPEQVALETSMLAWQRIADEYKTEITRLRTNIEALRTYAEDRELEYRDDPVAGVHFRLGMAAAYGDIARKCVVAAACDNVKFMRGDDGDGGK
ncbi:hypothetical protein [Paenibacillus abyssi]|uniref:Uncharacterized protein n=1 Tax=Paenibacillus abyssi TaxID=1340531 RepID=A0A917FIX2_9BACL|nr:hypothetical protein [Paenibacillus abyssi]GGF87944.1 hypothetical protein GCM10010916_01580 [Paenibacillus abyssi]